MCGIYSVFLAPGKHDRLLREKAFQCSRRQRHRGPDSTGVACGPNFCIVQERLSIIGLETGRQPLLSADGKIILAANGEIFNYKELAELISTRRGTTYLPRSDSDVIMAMFEEFGRECVSMLWGMYGFVMFNQETGELFGARDGLGICSLYYGVDEGRLYIASEMKCIPSDDVYTFPPGSMLTGRAESYEFTEFYKPQWSNITTLPADSAELARRLQVSVDYHMTSDVPVACFLSGGVNSSIIALLAQRAMDTRRKADDAPLVPLKTFAIGMEGSEDLAYARLAAEHIGTDHTELRFDAVDGIDLIPELIWHLETYDPFAIRSAVPMYILSRMVRSSGIKVLLSGEGADEIFGGYLYYNNAPTLEAFREETVRRLLDLHLSDGLRANKTSMAQSVELRAPFLGSPFVNYAMTVRAEDRQPFPRHHSLGSPKMPKSTSLTSSSESTVDKRADDTGGALSADESDMAEPRIEKWLLRKAFEGALPDEIIWRRKACFAEGVGAEWPRALERYANERISDADFEARHELYPYNTPNTKEEFLYRQIFSMEYQGEPRARTVSLWKPSWVPSDLD